MGRHADCRHRRRRRGQAVLAVLLAAAVFVVAACGPSGDAPEPGGTDSDETAPAEAQDAIVNGLETMFTWYPVRDGSTLDAYNRALPYFGAELRAGKDTLERGNSVWWQEWKAKKAEVTADALLVAGEHPADKPDTVQRAVVVTQTVKTPDGKELESNTMRIERVVAKKSPEGWRVEEISFFPVNEFRTQVCPPGQSHQPPPDGPCAPNPPPPPKQCPDGTTVAPDQMCPEPRIAPRTKQCPDGSTVAADATCPTGPKVTSPQPEPCPEGQVRDANGTCQPEPCPEGQVRGSDGTCQPEPCPDGQVRGSDGTCQPEPCPDGQVRGSDGTCGCPAGTELYNGTCVSPCPEGQVRGSDGTCGCPAGTELYNGSCVSPCPSGQVRGAGGTCGCPAGTELYNGSCVSPCPSGQVRGAGGTCGCPAGTELYNGSCVSPCPGISSRNASGTCVCPPGYTGTPETGCGSYVGAGPPPPGPRVEQMSFEVSMPCPYVVATQRKTFVGRVMAQPGLGS
ncbi:hypothetical protein [Mycolicibacterium wolinskyi]|uniref:hypothetical protein n=1 Tax=Mycolicibacterium wolinskyi TaxID=59750 RepID=UPI0010420612|nr:hypothetical protein [Mycolicibacterium wolinskyi]